jgi:hypothetical protein
VIDPAWFSAWQPDDHLAWLPGYDGIGLVLPVRESDCTGRHPAWYPFQIQVDACDFDAPSPEPLEGRQLTVPWP